MKEETRNVIEAVLESDSTLTPPERVAIMQCMCIESPVRKFIDAKEACRLLDVSRPTLRALVKNGVIEQINLTSRKARFDGAQVLQVANNGVSKGVISSK